MEDRLKDIQDNIKELRMDIKDMRSVQNKHSWYIGMAVGIALFGSYLLKNDIHVSIPSITHEQIIANLSQENLFMTGNSNVKKIPR